MAIAVVYFKAPSRYFPGGNEQNHAQPTSQ